MRIGVNAGSLERDLLEKYGEPCPEALVESAMDHIRILQDHDFHEFKVAVKASDQFLAVAAYQQIGRASCRERVCQYVSISVVAVSLKKERSKVPIGAAVSHAQQQPVHVNSYVRNAVSLFSPANSNR